TNPTGGASAWKVTPVDGTNTLNGVSCASTSLCVAVDDPGNAVTSTNPTGGASAGDATNVDSPNRLNGVSCATPSLCVAVDDLGNAVVGTGPPATTAVVASQQFGVPNQTDAFRVAPNGALEVRWVQGAGQWSGTLAISPAGFAPA